MSQVRSNRGRGERVDEDVGAAIRELVEAAPNHLMRAGRLNAAAIRRQLVREFGNERVPNTRTILDRIARYAPDPSGPWSLADSDGDGGRLVLEVQRALIEYSMSTRTPTRAEADWVIRIRRAAPSIPPRRAFHLAQRYIELAERPPRETKQQQAQREARLSELDQVLALNPWDSSRRFAAAYSAGLLSREQAEMCLRFGIQGDLAETQPTDFETYCEAQVAAGELEAVNIETGEYRIAGTDIRIFVKVYTLRRPEDESQVTHRIPIPGTQDEVIVQQVGTLPEHPEE
jgi:hypothetical protein